MSDHLRPDMLVDEDLEAAREGQHLSARMVALLHAMIPPEPSAADDDAGLRDGVASVRTLSLDLESDCDFDTLEPQHRPPAAQAARASRCEQLGASSAAAAPGTEAPCGGGGLLGAGRRERTGWARGGRTCRAGALDADGGALSARAQPLRLFEDDENEDDDGEEGGVSAFAPPWVVARLACGGASVTGPARPCASEGALRMQFQSLALKVARTRREQLLASALGLPLLALFAHAATIGAAPAHAAGSAGADGARAWDGGERLRLWCFGAALTNALVCALNLHQLLSAAAPAAPGAPGASGRAGADLARVCRAVPVLLPLPLLDFRMLSLLRVPPSRAALRRLPVALAAWAWGLLWAASGLARTLTHSHPPNWSWASWYLHRLVSTCAAVHMGSAALAFALAAGVAACAREGNSGGGLGGRGGCAEWDTAESDSAASSDSSRAGGARRGGEPAAGARRGSVRGLRCVRATRLALCRVCASARPLCAACGAACTPGGALLLLQSSLLAAAAASWCALHWRAASVPTSAGAYAFASLAVLTALLGLLVLIAARLAALRLAHVRAGRAGACAAALAACTPEAARADAWRGFGGARGSNAAGGGAQPRACQAAGAGGRPRDAAAEHGDAWMGEALVPSDEAGERAACAAAGAAACREAACGRPDPDGGAHGRGPSSWVRVCSADSAGWRCCRLLALPAAAASAARCAALGAAAAAPPALGLATTAYAVLASALLCLRAAVRPELAAPGASAALRVLPTALSAALAAELALLCAAAGLLRLPAARSLVGGGRAELAGRPTPGLGAAPIVTAASTSAAGRCAASCGSSAGGAAPHRRIEAESISISTMR